MASGSVGEQMLVNNWRRPWWIVFTIVWVGTFALLAARFEIEPLWAARYALAIASLAALGTWWALRARPEPPPEHAPARGRSRRP
ncbi:MAG: hypothetical protein DWI58_00450 [Chloroflexi bacterium]|nr:MAG: hypothetical protein DWI58_00450 [Chloroflexota bacterium]